MNILDRLLSLHHHLRDADIPHAFGGALALGWCTLQARGTVDIDVNIFIGTEGVDTVLAALPQDVSWTDAEVAQLRRDGQSRLRWDRTPIDLFFNTTEFHERAADRAQLQPFQGEHLPFLACRDLAVFKAFFNRPKDWVDLEAMLEAETLDRAAVAGVLVEYLGTDDERIAKLLALEPPPPDPPTFLQMIQRRGADDLEDG